MQNGVRSGVVTGGAAATVVLALGLLGAVQGHVPDAIPYGDLPDAREQAWRKGWACYLADRCDDLPRPWGWVRRTRWGALAVLALGAAGPFAWARLRGWWWRRAGGHWVVVGTSDRAWELFERGFFGADPRVVVVSARPEPPWFHRRMVQVTVPAPITGDVLERRVGVGRAAAVVVHDEDDEHTLETLEALMQSTATRDDFPDRVVTWFREADRAAEAAAGGAEPGDDAARQLFAAKLGAMAVELPATYGHFDRARFWSLLASRLLGGGAGRMQDTQLFSLPSLEARAILDAFPPGSIWRLEPGRGASGLAPHLAVFGGGARAEALVVEYLLLAHVPGRPPPRITVGAPEPDRERRRLAAAFPQAMDIGQVDFIDLDPTSSADGPILSALFGGDAPPELAVVLQGKPMVRALRHSLALLALPAPPVVEWSPRVGPRLPRRGGQVSIERLHDEGLERAARFTHRAYLVEQLVRHWRRTRGRDDGADRVAEIRARPAIRPWSDLSEAMREDNRRQVEHARVKAAAVGVRLVDRGTPEAAGPELGLHRQVILRRLRQEAVAEAEHRRWMASKKVDGWQYDPVRDDARSRHPDLRPWAALERSIRELDEQAVDRLVHIAQRLGSGLRLERTARVVDAGGAAALSRWADAVRADEAWPVVYVLEPRELEPIDGVSYRWVSFVGDSRARPDWACDGTLLVADAQSLAEAKEFLRSAGLEDPEVAR